MLFALEMLLSLCLAGAPETGAQFSDAIIKELDIKKSCENIGVVYFMYTKNMEQKKKTAMEGTWADSFCDSTDRSIDNATLRFLPLSNRTLDFSKTFEDTCPACNAVDIRNEIHRQDPNMNKLFIVVIKINNTIVEWESVSMEKNATLKNGRFEVDCDSDSNCEAKNEQHSETPIYDFNVPPPKITPRHIATNAMMITIGFGGGILLNHIVSSQTPYVQSNLLYGSPLIGIVSVQAGLYCIGVTGIIDTSILLLRR